MAKDEINVTNEQMAEALGWVPTIMRQWGNVVFWCDPETKKDTAILPNFTNDLNLVYGIEATLTDEEWFYYKYNMNESTKEQFPQWNETTIYRLMKHVDAQTCCNALYPLLCERKG